MKTNFSIEGVSRQWRRNCRVPSTAASSDSPFPFADTANPRWTTVSISARLKDSERKKLAQLARFVQVRHAVGEAIAVVVAEVVGLLLRADRVGELGARLIAVEVVGELAPYDRVRPGHEDAVGLAHLDFSRATRSRSPPAKPPPPFFLSSIPRSSMPWTRALIFSAMARTTSGSLAASFGVVAVEEQGLPVSDPVLHGIRNEAGEPEPGEGRRRPGTRACRGASRAGAGRGPAPAPRRRARRRGRSALPARARSRRSRR